MNAEERQMPPPRGQPPRAQQQPTPPRNRSRCTWALPAAPRQQSQQHTSASTPTSPSARSTPTLSAARQPDSVPSSPGGRRMAAVLGAYQSPSTVLRPTDAQPAVDSSWWYGHAHPSSPDSGVDIEAGSCLSAVQSRFVFPDITASSDREEVPHATASGASPTPGAPRAGGASSALVPTSPGGRRLAAVFNAPVATPGPSFSSPRAALHFAATTNGTPAATSSFSPSVSATSRPSPRSTWRTPTSCGAPAQPPETAPLFVQAGVDCERGSGLANNSLQLAEQAVVGAGAVAVCGDGAAHQESEADAFYDVPPDGVALEAAHSASDMVQMFQCLASDGLAIDYGSCIEIEDQSDGQCVVGPLSNEGNDLDSTDDSAATEQDAAARNGVLFYDSQTGIRRIIPKVKGNSTLLGFSKANSSNLPSVDLWMLADYLAKTNWSPELRHFKDDRKTRKSYSDNAVGYVQLLEVGNSWILFARITPETSIRGDPYILEARLTHDNFTYVQCYHCLSRRGDCKHKMAFAAWLHYRTEEPSPTEVVCYWKRSVLCEVNMCLPTAMLAGPRIKVQQSAYKSDGSFLQKVLVGLKTSNTPSMLMAQFGPSGHPLSVYRLVCEFVKLRNITIDYESFRTHVCTVYSQANQDQISANTTDQSESSLWFALRWCRITASRLYSVANAGNNERESLIKKLFGAEKFLPSEAMRRGLRIEQAVCEVLEKKLKCKLKQGPLVLDAINPLFAASPDAIAPNFVVEIKSPFKNKNEINYVGQDGVPTKKVLLQLLLQMRVCQKSFGFLVLAADDFETSNKIKIVKVSYADHKNLLDESMARAELFYKGHVFKRLMWMLRSLWL